MDKGSEIAAGGRRRRRALLWFGGGLAVVLVLYGMSQVALYVWRDRLPDDAPRIAFSVDESWLVESGIMTSSYEQAFARAGGRLVWFRVEDVPDGTLKTPSPALPVNGEGAGENAATREMGVERDATLHREAIAALLDAREIDGLLLSGGGDVDPALYGGDPNAAIQVNRRRDDFEIALIEAAQQRGLPILGICRGCQILNVALGGTLRNLRGNEALNATHFGVSGHSVTLEADSKLADMLGVIALDDVYSFHGQAVDQTGPEVRVVATAGDGVAEAIETNGAKWIVAVQFHPEMAVTDEIQNRLFEGFVERAREHVEAKNKQSTDRALRVVADRYGATRGAWRGSPLRGVDGAGATAQRTAFSNANSAW